MPRYLASKKRNRNLADILIIIKQRPISLNAEPTALNAKNNLNVHKKAITGNLPLIHFQLRPKGHLTSNRSTDKGQALEVVLNVLLRLQGLREKTVEKIARVSVIVGGRAASRRTIYGYNEAETC